MPKKPRILVTAGEPAGIGPDICVALAQNSHHADLVFIADPDVLLARARQLNLPLTLTETLTDERLAPHTLKIMPVAVAQPVIAGELNPENAAYVLETLRVAAKLCLQKQADAVLTAPVHKGVINQAGIPFKGHTEFFAEQSNVKQTVMLFAAGALKVALATTHLPLKDVSQTLTPDLLRDVIVILHRELQTKFHIVSPRLLIAGLNPHAGEGGYLGREELDVMLPVIQMLRAQGLNLSDPLPADTIFTPHRLQSADAVLAMYHDQGLPLIKYASFGHAVNVTLGLPFIRTSVDHGTALDIAGTGQADASSLLAALKLTLELCS